MTVTRNRTTIKANQPFDDQIFRNIVSGLMLGRTNNGGEVTLTANSATTTLTDPLINKNSVIHFVPTTANAKAEGTPYYADADLAEGSATLRHANNAQTDRTYKYTVNC